MYGQNYSKEEKISKLSGIKMEQRREHTFIAVTLKTSPTKRLEMVHVIGSHSYIRNLETSSVSFSDSSDKPAAETLISSLLSFTAIDLALTCSTPSDIERVNWLLVATFSFISLIPVEAWFTFVAIISRFVADSSVAF